MTAGTGQPSARELNAAAVRAMGAGDFLAAKQILAQALKDSPQLTPLWLNLAACCRALSDIPGALAAVDGALKAEPRSFMALLMKGSLFEAQGRIKEAARIYGFAIALEPHDGSLDAPTTQVLKRARELNARYVEEMVSFVSAEIGQVREKGSSAEAKRLNKFMDFALRRKTTYRQEPSDFFYPGLPSIEFYEREEFPWIDGLDASTPMILSELHNILRDDFRDFTPYVNYPDSVPLDQWLELNHSRRWGALHLYLSGKQMPANCSRCPGTMEFLASMPQPHMPGRSPAALFSALQPKTRIPPHTGVANTRLVVHLPLIVPEGCGFRVGNEVREWKEGEAWVFDDTIEHEAWNESTQPRVIFIFDIWNPRLSEVEREGITRMVDAMDKFNGFAAADGI